MKKIIFLFLIVHLTFNLEHCICQWVWQNPLPQGNGLYSSSFVNDNTGWMAGGSGTIIKTTNSGTNWIYNPLCSFSTPAYNLFFVDNQTGWVIGGSNYLYNEPSLLSKTTDGGLNWISQSIYNFNYTFYGLYFINNNTGWIIGDGILLKTTNSGNNWNILVTSTVSGNSIKFFNENAGYIAAGNGLYKSINGGINWNFENYNQSIFVQNSYFLNPNTGWIAGYNGAILKTTNGGSVFVKNISKEIWKGFSLLQNYPNPFNPTTVIGYSLLVNGFVTLKVYDILGREIATLVNEFKKAGTYEIQFPNNKYTINQLPSGVYFYRLQVGDPNNSGQVFSETKKLVLLK